MPKINQTSAGLRTMLFEELSSLRAGTSTPAHCHAVVKLTNSIIATVRLELDVQVRLGDGDGLPTSLKLVA